MGEPPDFRIDLRRSAAAATLHVCGALDGDGAGSVVAEAICLVAEGHRHLVVDCAAVTFCDSFWLGAISLLSDLVQPDGSLTIARPSRAIARILDLSRLAGRFEVLLDRSGPTAQLERLAAALQDQAAVEQAKGVVAERTGLDIEQTLTLLCDHAAHHHLRLVDLARGIVDGTVGAATLDTLY